MTSQISSDEARAILESVQDRPAAESAVEARDFRRPRRLSTQQIDYLLRRTGKAVPAIETTLRTWFRSPHHVEISGVSEIHTRELLRSFAPPFTVLAFRAGGTTGWATWEQATCVRAAEVTLGATAIVEAQPRDLTPVECAVLKAILTRVAEALAAAVGLQVEQGEIVHDLDALARTEDVHEGRETRRIAVHVAVQGAVGAATIRVYFAGVDAQAIAPSAPAAGAARPAGKAPARPQPTPHRAALSAVPVEVGALLATAEVPLSDLLGLAVGDVIALDTPVESPISVHVDGVACASARLGEHDGRLALRITAVDEAARADLAPAPPREKRS